MNHTDLDNHITGHFGEDQFFNAMTETQCDECGNDDTLHPVYVGTRNSGSLLEVLLCGRCYGQRQPVSLKAQKSAIARQSV